MNLRKPYRRFQAILLFFLLSGLALLTANLVLKQSGRIRPADLPEELRTPEPEPPPGTERYAASLYFLAAGTPDSSRGLLSEEKRLLPRQGTLADQARRLLEELNGPSRDGHLAPLPPQARLLQLFILKEGSAVVNYSQDLMDRHTGGVEGEIATIYAIVNTLTRNFPEIASVRILIEGSERDTLAGHVDLSGELKQDLSFVRGFEHTPTPIRIETLPP